MTSISQLASELLCRLRQRFLWPGVCGYLETMYAGVGSELLYRPLVPAGRWVWTLTT